MGKVIAFLLFAGLALAQYTPPPGGTQVLTGYVQGAASIPATQYLIPVSSGTAGTLGISTLKLNGSVLYPTTDSTTAIQIDKADGTTNVLTVDTTNGRVGIGTTAPGMKL